MGIRDRFIQILLGLLFLFAGFMAQSQEAGDRSDSLYAARLMEDNLQLYTTIDSITQLLNISRINSACQRKQADSLRAEIAGIQAQLSVSLTRSDTLEQQRLRLKQMLVDQKQQMLELNTQLEAKLQLLREREFQLSTCQAKLKDAESAASLNQARLEGKLDVNTTRVEAGEREIAYLKESMKEKDRIIAEKTEELDGFYHDKSNSLRIVDSLSRSLNSCALESARISERLRIIEGQYNEMLAQKTAAQNKKKKVRFVQGVALKSYRTPDWQLAPQSSSTTATYVITNKNAGKIEFDYITGVSLSLYDLSKPDGKYTYDAGLFLGFGGTNLFKNFYISPSFKAFDFFHFMLGVNVAEYQQLQGGFSEGDALPPGMSIPTVKEWKANMFLGMTIDFELLSNIPKKF
jgi:hypothetical protein